MINELNSLKSKVAQVATLCRTLRAENAQLRKQLAAAEIDRVISSERMESARRRLELLAEQLPVDKTLT